MPITLGMGHAFVPLSSTALFGVPAHDAGAASALVNTMQQVGGALGVAFLNTIATTATTSYAVSHGGLSAAAVVRGFTSAWSIDVGILLVALVVVVTFVRWSGNGGPTRRAGLPADDPYPDPAPEPVFG